MVHLKCGKYFKEVCSIRNDWSFGNRSRLVVDKRLVKRVNVRMKLLVSCESVFSANVNGEQKAVLNSSYLWKKSIGSRCLSQNLSVGPHRSPFRPSSFYVFETVRTIDPTSANAGFSNSSFRNMSYSCHYNCPSCSSSAFPIASEVQMYCSTGHCHRPVLRHSIEHPATNTAIIDSSFVPSRKRVHSEKAPCPMPSIIPMSTVSASRTTSSRMFLFHAVSLPELFLFVASIQWIRHSSGSWRRLPKD